MQDRKWTVGMVSYKTSVFIKWQLKILYEFNKPEDFNLIIVDNSLDKQEKEKLDELIAPYSQTHNNIRVIYHQPTQKPASGQHGEGLEIIHQMANSKYLLLNDPDYFWVKKSYLEWLETILSEKVPVVGAPYDLPIAEGAPNFPSAFGAAYLCSAIKGCDFKAYLDNDYEKSVAEWKRTDKKKGMAFTYDAGWKVRKALSNDNAQDNFLVFSQKIADYLVLLFGMYSFELIPRQYKYLGDTVAFHLHRGSFTGKVSSRGADPGKHTPEAWNKTRDNYGQYFYDYIGGKEKEPGSFRKITLSLRLVSWLTFQHRSNMEHLSAKKRIAIVLNQFWIGRRLKVFIKKWV